jgi:membrane-bound lytic murein transglycosylase B
MKNATKRGFLGSALLASASIFYVGTVPSAPVTAQSSMDFRTFTRQLGQQAVAQGVRQSTVDAVIPTLVFNETAVRLDRAQPGGTPNGPIPKFAPYRATHVDAARVAGGRAKYQQLRPLLARVERETGVPESIMIAIYGHETNYGRVTGNYDLLEALATLAYEGRRRALFSEEFIATLKLMDRGIPRWKLKGSWAGATGYPQFLPSMYARLGKDGDGDGRIDIWANEADALASIANYFVNAGWRPNMAWGTPVRFAPSFNPESFPPKTVSPRCARVHARHSQWKTVADWKRLGVEPLRAKLRDSDLAFVFQPDGPGTSAWLLTGNYKVILEYNCSNFYGLSVGLLADAVES